MNAKAVCEAAAEARERSRRIVADLKRRRAAAGEQRRLAGIQREKVRAQDTELKVADRERLVDQRDAQANRDDRVSDERRFTTDVEPAPRSPSPSDHSV